jgi:hypothetical protein
MRATNAIPIVASPMGADPVAAGVAASWARPGANVTGASLIAPELEIKRLDILCEAVLKARRIATLSTHRRTPKAARCSPMVRSWAYSRYVLPTMSTESSRAPSLVACRWKGRTVTT